MKKLISISLVLAMASGLILAENKKAEALDPASAVLIGASVMLFPLIAAVSHEHDHYRPAPYYSGEYPAPTYYGSCYSNPYPARTRVYYSGPRYEGYYGRNWNRGHGDERDWRSHRRYSEHRRDFAYGRDRYTGRHYRDND